MEDDVMRWIWMKWLEDLLIATHCNRKFPEAPIAMTLERVLELYSEGHRVFARCVIGGMMRGANLTGTNLEDACMTGVQMEDTNFEEAVLFRANVRKGTLNGGNFSGAKLMGANLWAAGLYHCEVGGANFSGANLTSAGCGKWTVNGRLLAEAVRDLDEGLPDMSNVQVDPQTLRQSGWDVEICRWLIQSGAQFLVSPDYPPDIVDLLAARLRGE
ncbi:MAG: pentapeptide repeat-containing protein [Candidatus Magasanikbacteria bacterium]